jgi:hypothetical protein
MAKRPEGFTELMAKRPGNNSEILHQITCEDLFDKGVFVECQETPLGKAGKQATIKLVKCMYESQMNMTDMGASNDPDYAARFDNGKEME